MSVFEQCLYLLSDRITPELNIIRKALSQCKSAIASNMQRRERDVERLAERRVRDHRAD